MLEIRPTRFAGLATLVLLVLLVLSSSISSSAMAATGVSGQLGNWEEIELGVEPGHLFNPSAAGVDPVDGSTYIVSNNVGATQAEINKFTTTGGFEGSVAISRRSAPGGLELPLSLVGIAVDHADSQFYVVESEAVESTPVGEATEALNLLVYSTKPAGSSGKELKLIASHPLPGPTEPGAIFNPTELHADETTGELVINGENAAGEPLLQRLSSMGAEGKFYAESGTTLTPKYLGVNFAFDVAADGTTYVLSTAGSGSKPAKISAFSLPPEFEPPAGALALTPVPGFTAAGAAEGWGTRPTDFLLENAEGLWGPQFAVVTAPDGEETLYWKTGSEEGEDRVAVRIHGYSIQQEATTPAFGGGPEEPECTIESSTTALASTTDGDLMAFSQGQEISSPSAEPEFGPNVYRFGSGGGGCGQFDPAPLIELKAGNQQVSTVTKGSSVMLDAAGSEEGETTIESLVWMIEDPMGHVESIPVGGPTPSLISSHTFSEEGTYTIRLKIKTADPVGPTPPPVNGENDDVVGDEFVAKPKTLIVKAAGAPIPEITSIAPSKGPAAGGTEVTITGENLTGATAVEFGTVAALGTITVNSAGTQITGVKSPAGTAGTKAPIKVTTPEGTASSTGEFEWEAAVGPAPTITAFSPIKGPAAGGTTVTISGEHLAGATAVQFGTAAGTVDSDTETQITVTSPAGTGGTAAPIKVTTPGGSATSTNDFEWEVVPPLVTHKLTVTKGGAGSGTVQCDGGGCQAEYAVGSTVTLTAVPDSGSTFAGWSGGGCSGTAPCDVVIETTDLTVGATFNTAPPANNPPSNNPPANSPPGTGTPPGGGSKTKTAAQKLKEKEKKALQKCKKLHGNAKAQCVKRAKQIGKPKKKSKPKSKPKKKNTSELIQVVGREVL